VEEDIFLKGIEYVKKGFIKVPIFEVFNFEKVKEAHKIIEERKQLAKLF